MCFDFLPASQAYFGFVAIDLLNLQHMEPNPSPDSLSLWSVYMAFVGLFSTKYLKDVVQTYLLQPTLIEKIEAVK